MNRLASQGIAPIQDERTYFAQVFAWMAIALAVTGAVAGAIGSSSTALHALFDGRGFWLIIALFLVEFLLVAGLAGLVQHMGLFEARTTFLAYAALNGVTLSVIFAVYTTKSIFSSFLVTAGMFGAMALWGYTTKADLTGWGSFLFMALI